MFQEKEQLSQGNGLRSFIQINHISNISNDSKLLKILKIISSPGKNPTSTSRQISLQKNEYAQVTHKRHYYLCR